MVLRLSGRQVGTFYWAKRQKAAHTRVVPREKLREERVVMRQRLAGSSRIGGSLARSSEVGKLRRSFGALVLDILSDRA
jgi:hypothetical protein